MRQSYGTKITVFLTAICGAAALYGLIAGEERLIAGGMGAGFIFLLLIPAFRQRSARVDKIRAKQDALVEWEYGPHEIEKIVEAQRPVVRKTSASLALLVCVCLIVIFAPFVVLSMQEDSGLPPMLPIAIPVVLAPWLAMPLAPGVVARKVRRQPCVSLIGRDYILVANRYLGINDRHALTAVEAKYEPSQDGDMATLHVRYQFKVGRLTFLVNRWVGIPVPYGREREAANLSLPEAQDAFSVPAKL